MCPHGDSFLRSREKILYILPVDVLYLFLKPFVWTELMLSFLKILVASFSNTSVRSLARGENRNPYGKSFYRSIKGVRLVTRFLETSPRRTAFEPKGFSRKTIRILWKFVLIFFRPRSILKTCVKIICSVIHAHLLLIRK